jgi:hypothetical protein
MPKQLCNCSQIHSGHNKSTGKRMAVAMPRLNRYPDWQRSDLERFLLTRVVSCANMTSSHNRAEDVNG